ncbi:hypothetical protein M409DRAFT_16809 [Zasmidium cellare ATCC 36951]|uniref:Ecp2 effector protein domain-containing protein n=1 Tax=Zasmidium cellare ATCC 36951 TaxID=1080233 RepID=A0A6A6D0B1_ZASCE|nr:uncharacterized protein M409DRAFT_16809 [Zasmidium cellare ATCC 36951]KAF2172854.1 hypothetical protein M409DRAFT_16809 [Zasmidium cellare ATCC 36951]
MQSLAALFSVLFLFGSNGFAHPIAEVLSSPDDLTLAKRDSVHCYDSGFKVPREALTSVIDKFCDQVNAYDGLRKNNAVSKTYSTVVGHSVVVSVTPKKCGAIDQELMCKVILRMPVDQCDTSSTSDKQGGTVDTGCATWRVDPEEAWV